MLSSIWKCGRARLIASVLKTEGQKCSVSSNLTASANFLNPPVAHGRAGCLISICPDKTQDVVRIHTGGPVACSYS